MAHLALNHTHAMRHNQQRPRAPEPPPFLLPPPPMLSVRKRPVPPAQQDEEARELIEKIKKVNPRADIASVVLQSTSTTPPVTSTSWVGNGGLRRPRSGKTIAATTVTTAAAALPSAEVGAGMSSSSTDQESPIFPERELSRDQQIHYPDEVMPRATRNGDGEYTPEGDVVHPRGRGGGSGVGAQRRSLMGRMLASGVLDRQREWTKARGKKVTVRSRLSYPIHVQYVHLHGNTWRSAIWAINSSNNIYIYIYISTVLLPPGGYRVAASSINQFTRQPEQLIPMTRRLHRLPVVKAYLCGSVCGGLRKN